MRGAVIKKELGMQTSRRGSKSVNYKTDRRSMRTIDTSESKHQ